MKNPFSEIKEKLAAAWDETFNKVFDFANYPDLNCHQINENCTDDHSQIFPQLDT